MTRRPRGVHVVEQQLLRRGTMLGEHAEIGPLGARVAPNGNLLPSWPILVSIRPCLGVCDDLLCFLYDRLQVLFILKLSA
jgi:hypothetical protein